MAKYNPETVKQVISFIEDRLSQKDACRPAKIGESTFYDWIKQKPEFLESVELAIIRYKIRLFSCVNSQEELITGILDKDTVQTLLGVYDEMKELAKMTINQNKSDKV